MQNLPTAEVYEKEFKYMPWGILISEILELVKKTPENGTVLDLMCGPGYLLQKIKELRPDLELKGVDMESEFIDFAKEKYKGIDFVTTDASDWNTDETYNLILVTGGVHHLPYEKQESFISKVSSLLEADGMAIVADPYIDDYTNEEERKIGAAKLGYEYLVASMKNGADIDIQKACISIMENDVLGIEFKNSINRFKPILEKYFTTVEMHKTWPTEQSQYGDYYFVLSNSK